MGLGRREFVYTDVGESAVEEAGRLENEHFRQDPPLDFTDPTEVIAKQPGTKRRTTINRESPIDGGPRYKTGRKTGWYVLLNVTTNEYELVSVQTSGELADLPQDALPAGEYANLLAQENEGLAAHLFSFLRNEATHHTAHHTGGSDLGKRAKLIFARDQLSYIDYQDSQIGENIVVPSIRSRAKDPSTIVGPDNVEW